MRWVVVAALGAAMVAGCESSTDPQYETYVVEVSGEEFRVRVSDAVVMADLDARMASGEEGVISGKLLAGNGGYNTPWSWRLDPATVHVADVAIELCDGRPSMVEADTAYWIRTVKQFCPWGAKVLRQE